MNTKTLSQKALSVIDQYVHFSVGKAVCSIPYFNNKTIRAKAALRAYVGKGSPQDIHDEVTAIMIKQHISAEVIADESLKKLLTDANIGIDCSGLAYYILNAELEERGKGSLAKNLKFVKAQGFLGKLYASFRPVENCDVARLADNANSRVVAVEDVQPGDIITMIDQGKGSNEDRSTTETSRVTGIRNHILIVHQVDYKESVADKKGGVLPTGGTIPVAIYYTHAVAYPEDGVYGTGIKQGKIEVGDVGINNGGQKNILEGVWSESGSVAGAERIFNRAKVSKTELRRLNIF